MPLYLYECPRCNWQRSDMRAVADRMLAPTCDQCKRQMGLIIPPVAGIVRNPAVPRGNR